MKSKDLKQNEKFYMSKHTKIWSSATTGFAFVVYVVMLIVIELAARSGGVPYGLYVARDISLVVFTILLTSIITSGLIEVRSKNELYHDTVFHDVISNPAFYREFSDETKEEMLNNLEQELLFSGCRQIQNMYGSIQEKLSEAKEAGYYTTECSYRVSVHISGDVITKEISRTLRLRSYRDTCKVEKLNILKWSGIEISEHFTLLGVELNGMPTKEYGCETTRDPSNIDSFCGYTVSYHYYMEGSLQLSAQKDTVISVSYCTRVPISDNIYTCRSSVPCKKFSVSARLEDSPGYKINAVAFGFLDTAKRSPTRLADHEVHVEFDDWVFNKDGIVVVFAPSPGKAPLPAHADPPAEDPAAEPGTDKK